VRYKDKNWLYNRYYIDNKSMKQIGKECGVSEGTIVYYMKKYNIKRRNRSDALFIRKRNKPIVVNEELKEFLIGNILGDGSIQIHGRNSLDTARSGAYAHSSKYYNVLKYINNFLNFFGIKRNGNIRKYKHPESGAIYYSYWTKYYEELLHFRKYLYKNNKKIIPRNLEFTPTICLHWYIGDGSLSKPKCGKPYIRICTQGFSVDDVNFAVQKFINMGFIASRQPSGNTIRFLNKYNASKKFLEYIGDCPKEIKDIYGYKFNR